MNHEIGLLMCGMITLFGGLGLCAYADITRRVVPWWCWFALAVFAAPLAVSVLIAAYLG